MFRRVTAAVTFASKTSKHRSHYRVADGGGGRVGECEGELGGGARENYGAGVTTAATADRPRARSQNRSACEFLQRTVLGQHGAVSNDVTIRGRGVIFS